MVIFQGFLLAALSSATITAWVVGISDLYVGRYGDGITLVVLAAIVSLLLLKISIRYLNEISKVSLDEQSGLPTEKGDEGDLLPPVIYDTIGYGLIIIALLAGVGGPLASDDYMGKFLNPAIGIFLLLAGTGVFWLKKNRAGFLRAGRTDKAENQAEIQPLP